MSARPSNSLPWCPALGLACCFSVGIVLQNATDLALWLPLIVAVSACGLLVGLAAAPRRRIVTMAPIATAVLIAVGAIAGGSLRLAIADMRPPGDVSHVAEAIDDRSITIDGRIRSFVQDRPDGARFDVDVTRMAAGRHLIASSGTIRIFLRAEQPPALFRGQIVALSGRFQKPPMRRNPADFDYGAFLERQGIRGQMYVEASGVALLQPSRPIFFRTIETIRDAVGQAIDQAVPSPSGRIVIRALMLGDRTGLSNEERERLARSGLMHLLAVSGLHVLLVGLVLYQLLRPMLLRFGLSWRLAEWCRALVTLLVLGIYMLITGSPPSVVRAVTMAGLFIGATLVQRQVQSINTLGAAALVLLLIRPYELYAAGFQLSFSAVGGIILFGRQLRPFADALKSRPAALSYTANSVAVSLAASLGTLPVLLFHFGQASFSGLILNLVAIPATFGALASGILLALTASLPMPAASAFGHATDVLANLVLCLAAVGEKWSPVALVETRLHNGWWLGALTSATLAAAMMRHARIRWRLVVVTMFCACLATWTSGPTRGSLDVIFFDVGQGDAALLRTPGGRAMLIDAGPRSPVFDAGERIIHPNLAFLGIDRLDAVVISHPHSDHLGGLPHLLRAMPIGVVYHNGSSYESSLVREVDHVLDSLGIEHRPVRSGDVLELEDGIRIKVLAPSNPETSSVNDASVVLRITYGNVSFLMTGDAEAPSEAKLSRYFASLLGTSVIKAGHHGSSTSSTEALVERARTEASSATVVVSVGKRNRYRHPSGEVLERWRQSGRDVRLTSEEGAIWFRSDGRSIEEVRWK